MKLDTKKTIFTGLAFLSICAFWQMYDNVVPLILTKTFNLNETISGAVMATGWVKSAGSETPISKMETYQLADQMCARFKAQNGTTICSELKGIGNPAGPLRSCPGCIQDAVDIAIDVLQADARAGA